MKITSHQLEAFYETAQLRSFSKAADKLAVTQSALSQRIAHLEDDLEATLFIRDPSGPILTTVGELLLRHCQVTNSLEQEFLGQLKSSADQFRGTLRIAGFSSILRSVIIPSLAAFLRASPEVHCEFRSCEVDELVDILRNAEADFVILDYQLQKKGITAHNLGKEEYVIIESAKYPSNGSRYLDNTPDDNTTEAFFHEQGDLPRDFQRSFMGDTYGIINGVELGLGRAVMPKHLLKNNSRIKIVKSSKRYYRDITLNYFEQPYYSRLHKEVIQQLSKNASGYL